MRMALLCSGFDYILFVPHAAAARSAAALGPRQMEYTIALSVVLAALNYLMPVDVKSCCASRWLQSRS